MEGLSNLVTPNSPASIESTVRSTPCSHTQAWHPVRAGAHALRDHPRDRGVDAWVGMNAEWDALSLKP